MESLYSQMQQIQFGGPTSSTEYNERIENNFKDLVVLYNKARVLGEDIREGFSHYAKDQLSLTAILSDLETRVGNLENARKRLTFSINSQIDNNRFINTPFAINTVSICSQDINSAVITPPQVPGSSVSKLSFTSPQNNQASVPSTLGTSVVGVDGTADSPHAVIDSSDPSLAIVRIPGRLWERNVIVPSPTSNGAQCYLYIRCPIDLFTTAYSNTLYINPYPALGTNVVGIDYTTTPNPVMQDVDGYIPLNAHAIYANDTDAIGWVPPGGWLGDKYTNAGPRTYYFPPTSVTGLRLLLEQPDFFIENNQFIYTYGLAQINLQYTKFLSTGQTAIRYDLPVGTTISSVLDVEPEIWNIPQAAIPNVFSYQIVYETSYNSGVYTTSPISNSRRFWIFVTLTVNIDQTPPSLSALNITYE